MGAEGDGLRKCAMTPRLPSQRFCMYGSLRIRGRRGSSHSTPLAFLPLALFWSSCSSLSSSPSRNLGNHREASVRCLDSKRSRVPLNVLDHLRLIPPRLPRSSSVHSPSSVSLQLLSASAAAMAASLRKQFSDSLLTQGNRSAISRDVPLFQRPVTITGP